MKHLLLSLLMLSGITSFLFAGFSPKNIEASLTVGNNVFDQPSCFLAHKKMYGIRGGIYNDNGLGFLLGYERANDVNCPDCPNSDLERFSASVVQEMHSPVKLIPYAIATLGYENSSNDKVSSDQTFLGLGAGLKYRFTKNLNTFIDLRALRKFDAEQTDIQTTFGIAYLFQTPKTTSTSQTKESNTTQTPPIVELDLAAATTQHPQNTNIEEVIIPQTAPVTIETSSSASSPKSYYVQAGAYATTYPGKLLKKLKDQGIPAKTKEVVRNGKKLTLVVTGPYKSKSAAKRALRKVRKSVPQAFVTKL